jgi:hypothetical protein
MTREEYNKFSSKLSGIAIIWVITALPVGGIISYLLSVYYDCLPLGCVYFCLPISGYVLVVWLFAELVIPFIVYKAEKVPEYYGERAHE